jgi:hypothetical protein
LWPDEVTGMANRSYLCVTDCVTLYPSTGDPAYDPEQQTVAACAYAVPLLWMALFRPENMRTQTFEVNGEPVEGIAPLAKMNAALAHLDRAAAMLNRLFPAEGPLDEHAALLRQAVEEAPGLFVTIEMGEIADLSDPEDFYQRFREVLEGLSAPAPTAEARARVADWLGLEPGQRFPTARCFLEQPEVSKAEAQMHSRLLGFEWVRPWPW